VLGMTCACGEKFVDPPSASVNCCAHAGLILREDNSDGLQIPVLLHGTCGVPYRPLGKDFHTHSPPDTCGCTCHQREKAAQL